MNIYDPCKACPHAGASKEDYTCLISCKYSACRRKLADTLLQISKLNQKLKTLNKEEP